MSLLRAASLLLMDACSLGSLAMFSLNLLGYRAPRIDSRAPHQVSVLIPARNEEQGIVAAVRSVLASKGVELEVLVLDDDSADRTADLVSELARQDGRLTLHSAPALPVGWNGKQHACAVLARLARFDALCFLDADVRLAPEALMALMSELQAGSADLLSGFPKEETETWLEKLLIPLIHFVLLCYLPLSFARTQPTTRGLAAGCGQVMLVRRHAYEAAGGHAAIRETMHDGLLLPRLFRERGFATDLFDLTALARCRMYRNAAEVWRGLGKNATEGMGAPARILPFSLLLFFGQVLPLLWLGAALALHGAVLWAALALAAGYLVRLVSAWRFHQSLFGALLHPVAVAILLLLQWWALGRKLFGVRAVWKQRAYDVG